MDTEKIRVNEIDGVKLDITNEEFNNAVDFVQHTDRLVYLTGKAGTGKTTFLKYIKETVKKNYCCPLNPQTFHTGSPQYR